MPVLAALFPRNAAVNAAEIAKAKSNNQIPFFTLFGSFFTFE
jgi:hypothetical protein